MESIVHDYGKEDLFSIYCYFAPVTNTTKWYIGQNGKLVKPMQMRRQEGPLGKPANLAKIANLSKSPRTRKRMQMRIQEGALSELANLGEFGNVVEIADNLKANEHEQTKGPFVNLATSV